MAPGPVRRDLLVGGAVVGHAGELHPAVCAALELPRRTCAMELDLDAVPLPGVTAGAGDLDLPAGADRRGAGGRRARYRRRRCEAALVDGRRRRCWSRCACSTCTPARRSAPGRKSLAYKLVLRAPDRTLTAEEAVAARDAAVAAAGALGAVLRG